MSAKEPKIKKDPTNYEDFGKRIRLARQHANMTQEELAEQAGITASFLGHIERGTRVASIGTMVALCNTLNITPEYLLRASLTVYTTDMPDGLSPRQRDLLGTFTRTAADLLSEWNQE